MLQTLLSSLLRAHPHLPAGSTEVIGVENIELHIAPGELVVLKETAVQARAPCSLCSAA